MGERKGEDVLILFSGGADSALMVELALKMGKSVYCLMIDYDQLHKGELDYAKKYLEKKGIKYQIVTVRGLALESGLTGHGEQGTFGSPDKISVWHVPGRNTMFLGLALSIAENLGIPEIFHGADFSDRLNLFPDCFQEYAVRVNKLLEIAGPKPVKYIQPLAGMTKEMILSLLESFGIKKEDLFSGYGDIKPQSASTS